MMSSFLAKACTIHFSIVISPFGSHRSAHDLRKLSVRLLHSTNGIQSWRDACKKVPNTKILPKGLGGNSNQGFQALLGDKILGAAAAHAFEEMVQNYPVNTDRQKELTVDEGCATDLFGIALSNRFFKAHADYLLPKQCIELARKEGMNSHSIGTMVEATVAAVHVFDEKAVKELASWLLIEAASIWIEANPKGHLLERGGHVEAVRIGGPDHHPIFQGIAKMDDSQAAAQANNRKSAERTAARKLLVSVGLYTDEDSFWEEKSSQSVSKMIKRENEWVPFEGDPSFHSLVLKDGESACEWWLRKAYKPNHSFHRASLAPFVFDQITGVDAWTRDAAGDPCEEEMKTTSCAALVVVASKDENDGTTKYNCFVERGVSRNRARGLAGQKANMFVGALVGLDDDQKSEN